MTATGPQELIATTHIDFGKHGAHWHELFSQALQRSGARIQVDYLERSSSVDETTVRLLIDGSPAIDVALKIKTSQKPAEVFLLGGSLSNERTLIALRESINIAISEFGRSTQHFKWTAALTQAPQVIHRPTRLTSRIDVGELSIEPMDDVFSDVDWPGRPLEGTYRIHRSIPILVRGKTQATSWESASAKADLTLDRLCGLLALSWTPPYEVATSPIRDTHGVASPRKSRAGICLAEHDREHAVAWETHPPLLCTSEAWARLHSTVAFQNALDAFLEGLKLEEKHKALALVAYVASVEGISNVVFDREKDADIAKSFKATLRIVLSEAQAQRLDGVYSWRSKTVHQGRLHRTEDLASRLLASVFTNDALPNLRTLLPELRSAARQLLIEALLGQLPPRRSLEGDEVGSPA